MKAFLAALQFLTIIPIPWTFTPEERRRSVWFFPWVGLLIGLMAMGLDAILQSVFPLAVTNVLVLLFLVGISGALHLDGLADTADGLFSCRSRETVLEIMRDSRSGPMGVTAIVMVLLLKYAALGSLPPETRRPALLLAPMAGRCATVLLMGCLPYARPAGLAEAFQATFHHALVAALALAAIGWLVSGRPGLLSAAASIVVALLWTGYCHRRLRGYTGDTLGAACELVEVIPLLTMSVFVP